MPTVPLPLARAPRSGVLDRERQRREARALTLTRLRARRGEHQTPARAVARLVSSYRSFAEHASRVLEALPTTNPVEQFPAPQPFPRMSVVRYRDENGRFAKAPLWWRPRDVHGRFCKQDGLRLPRALVAPPARDRFGKFLPKDVRLQQHILAAQDELLAEGTPRAEVQALASPDRWQAYRERIRQEEWAHASGYTTGGTLRTVAVDGQWTQHVYNAYPGWWTTSSAVTMPVTNMQIATNDWFDQSTTSVYTSNHYQNYYYDNSPPRPAEMRLRARITDSQFKDHPDPDALLGDTVDDLKAQLAQQIGERYHMSTDDIWERWTFDATTRYEPAQSDVERADPTARAAWDAWVIEMRAVNVPPAVGATGGVWHDWAVEVWHDVDASSHRRAPRERQPTVAELRERAAVQRRSQMILGNRDRAHRLRKKVAARKAKELLLSCLDAEQRADLERARGFRVVLPSGRTYWVAKGYAGNVYRIDEHGMKITTYCIHGPSNLPDEDHMLTQKLLLETDENSFLRVANASPSGHGRVPLCEAA